MGSKQSPLGQEAVNIADQDVPETERVPASLPAEASAESAATAVPQTVRFSSQAEEIPPEETLSKTETSGEKGRGPPLTEEQKEELRNLSQSMQQDSILQKRRMSNFVFEPVSLPASRVPSAEGAESRHGSVASRAHQSVHTPPLTPAGSESKDQLKPPGDQRPSEITPQSSGPYGASAATTTTGSRPGSADATATKDTTVSPPGSRGEAKQRPVPRFAGGTGSGTQSRDRSPRRPPGTPPLIDENDPAARAKKPPPSRLTDQIDSSQVIRDARRNSSLLSPGRTSSAPPKTDDSKAHGRHGSTASQDTKRGSVDEHKHGSLVDLKRFFHFGHHHKKSKDSSHAKAAAAKSGTATPPHHAPATAIPFAEDHGLESKYGKFGKVLGSGAGGSVRLMKRPSDGVTFAVKQFRERHQHETEKDYVKKVTAEFCVGSTLHHGNIIETMDIINERGQWYEVMEYAPFDLFNIVMTGKMSREEVACCFVQIFSGVVYLHSMGLAHRDLKLDNVVVNEHGIMKIIDFGSAIVFRYPFETETVMATGCVGSDPYLAPEVYDSYRYAPQPTDVWSLGIIFACMSLRRFPWKAPRLADNSYRLFAAAPTPGTPPAEGALRRKTRDGDPNDDSKSTHSSHHHHHRTQDSAKSEPNAPLSKEDSNTKSETRSETIKGPWRLLRLLPRESRTIIGLMLEIDPKKRATIEEMQDDPWISNVPVCKQVGHGQIIKATGHTHTLETSSGE